MTPHDAGRDVAPEAALAAEAATAPPHFDSSAQPAESPFPMRVIAVSSNKGGVGKTTVSANLAIYLRAVREDLPVLIVGLDDQDTLDRMFSVEPLGRGAENLKHGWAQRRLNDVIRLGQYGVHFVPSPPDTGLLKGRAEDPRTLRRILAATAWPGVVILDTKSDLEALTQNAYHAADRVIVPVADRASLIEAEKVFHLLERSMLGARRARVLFTLVDRRSRGGDQELHDVLAAEVERRGWPHYRTVLSRSPRVEALLSAEGRPQSILHAARGTGAHRQFHDLACEVIAELGLDRIATARSAEAAATATPPNGRANDSGASLDWKAALLRGTWLRRDGS